MSQKKTNLLIATSLILFAAILKVVTYPNSFNPIIAISLFSGAIMTDKKMAFLLPLLAMLLSDVLLEVLHIAPGFYGMGQIGNYAALLFVTVLGFFIKKISILNVLGFSIASSFLFFLLSNTNVYLFDNFQTYQKSFSGWMTCLAAGVPFLKNRIPTDLFFSVLLFGSYALAFRSQLSKKIIA